MMSSKKEKQEFTDIQSLTANMNNKQPNADEQE